MEVLVVGEVFLEFNRDGDCYTKNPGGKGLEIALAASSLGYETTLAASLGNDPFGHEIKEFLGKRGVQTHLLPQKTPIKFAEEEILYRGSHAIPLPEKKYETAILFASCITLKEIQDRKKRGRGLSSY